MHGDTQGNPTESKLMLRLTPGKSLPLTVGEANAINHSSNQPFGGQNGNHPYLHNSGIIQ